MIKYEKPISLSDVEDEVKEIEESFFCNEIKCPYCKNIVRYPFIISDRDKENYHRLMDIFYEIFEKHPEMQKMQNVILNDLIQKLQKLKEEHN